METTIVQINEIVMTQAKIAHSSVHCGRTIVARWPHCSKVKLIEIQQSSLRRASWVNSTIRFSTASSICVTTFNAKIVFSCEWVYPEFQVADQSLVRLQKL